MGNSNSSNRCDLHEYNDACEMKWCIKDIKGLKKDSASPTDTWIVTFKDGTTYNSSVAKSAFLKLWISRQTIENLKYNEDFKNHNQYDMLSSPLMLRQSLSSLENMISGLDYEAIIYKFIIQDLIRLNICPNFVKCFTIGSNCSFNDLVSMLQVTDRYKDQDPADPNFQPKLNLYRNINNIIIEDDDIKTYPVTVDDNDAWGDENEILENNSIKKFKFNMIVNETMDSPSLNEFVRRNGLFMGRSTNKPKQQTFLVIFQALAACYAMSSSKMVHQDLHLYNLYVQSKDTSVDEKRVNYKYGGNLFTFESDYIVKIFDFDRAYAEKVGVNILLNEDYTKENSQTNEYIENKDAIKMLRSIYAKCGTYEQSEIILNMCCDPTRTVSYELLKETWNKGNFLRTNEGRPLKTIEYKGFYSTFEILKNCAILAGIENIYPTGYIPNPKFTYICNSSMFDNKGKVKSKNISEAFINEDNISELKKENIILSDYVQELLAERDALNDQLLKQKLIAPGFLNKRKKMLKKPCKKGKVRNPLTQRCINKEQKKDIMEKPCKEKGKVRNPITKRCNTINQITKNKIRKTPLEPKRWADMDTSDEQSN